jgi:hypothetical protein
VIPDTNYTDWSEGKAISTKDSQHNMEIKRSLGMKGKETIDLNNYEIMLEIVMQVQQVSNTSLALEH